MITNFLDMGGYGIYVWSSFIFTFFICLAFFLRTKKSLKKVEKDFKFEAERLSVEKSKILKSRKISKEIIAS